MRIRTSIGCLAALVAALCMGGCDPYGTLTNETRLPGANSLPPDNSVDESALNSTSDRFLTLLAARLQEVPTTTTTSGSSVYVGPLTFYRDVSEPDQAVGGSTGGTVSTPPPPIETPTEEPPPIIPRGPIDGEHQYEGGLSGTVTETAEGATRPAIWQTHEDVVLLVDRDTMRLKAVYIPGMVFSPDIMIPIAEPGAVYEAEGISSVFAPWHWRIRAVVRTNETSGNTLTATVLVHTDGSSGQMTWNMDALHTTTVQLFGEDLLGAHYSSDTPYIGIWDVPSSDDPIFPLDITQRFEIAGDLASPD